MSYYVVFRMQLLSVIGGWHGPRHGGEGSVLSGHGATPGTFSLNNINTINSMYNTMKCVVHTRNACSECVHVIIIVIPFNTSSEYR